MDLKLIQEKLNQLNETAITGNDGETRNNPQKQLHV